MKRKKDSTQSWKRRNIIWLPCKMKNKRDLIPYWDRGGVAWLAMEIRLKSDEEKILFSNLIKITRRTIDTPAYTTLYHNINIPKPNGGYRTISIPITKLLKVQKRINKYVLSSIPSHPNAFGFSGGNIVDAIEPHLKNRVLYSFDIVDAFGQVAYSCVWQELYRFFSRTVSGVIAGLGFWTPDTLPEKLPQGSALSPRLFDIAFYPIDVRLNRLVEKFGGKYTRYADNIFVSLPMNTFPQKLRSAVLRRMKWPDGRGTRIECHKFSVRRLDKGAVRILGLNIIDGKISATREYKRNLRLAIHRVKYLIDNGRHPQAFSEWLNLRGRMSFAGLGVLPNSLIKSYSELEKIIEIRELEKVAKSYINLFDDGIQSKLEERTEDI